MSSFTIKMFIGMTFTYKNLSAFPTCPCREAARLGTGQIRHPGPDLANTGCLIWPDIEVVVVKDIFNVAVDFSNFVVVFDVVEDGSFVLDKFFVAAFYGIFNLYC